MTPIEKIKLSYRCDENYSKMTPCSLGRHCSSCDKTVIDFRENNLTQLTEVLEKHGTVCGIFTKDQIDIKTTIQKNILRRYVTSLLFTLGLGAFNKDIIAQNKNSDTLTHNNNTIQGDTTEVFLGLILETMPTYKNGGDKGLREFLKNNLEYPSDSIQGKVYVGFTVDSTGKVIDPKILRGLSNIADKEVLRVVKLLEFIPGTIDGKKANIKFNLPILFNRDKDKDKKTNK